MQRNFYISLRSFLRTRLLPNNLFPSNLLRNSSFLFLALLTFVSGCKKVEQEAGQTSLCPIVVTTNPAKNDIGVSVFANVNASFNKAMDSTTINSTSFTLMQGSTVVPGVVTYTGLTATVSGNEVTIYGIKYGATSSELFKITDNTGHNGSISALTRSVLAKTGANTVFRGLSLSPQKP